MSLRAFITALIQLALLLFGTESLAQRYSQMVVSFPNKRSFDYEFLQDSNALLIKVLNTGPEELEPLYNYDDRLVRRIIVKELPDQSSEIKIVLRDKKIQAAVYGFEEPHRIVIDLYDQNFRENRDPSSGLPLVQTQSRFPTQRQAPTASPQYQLASPSADGHYQLAQEDKREAKQDQLESKGSRRLLQPRPAQIESSQQLIQAMEKASPGVGPAWASYPPYIYRLQTGTIKTGKSYQAWLNKNSERAMGSGDAMADYASQLYEYGHELRSLIAFQKVLHESPLSFDRNAEYIWNLAEIHFGQGNNILAKGYYQSLIEKHPDSPLHPYAAMRIVDIEAINAIQKSEWKRLASLVPLLDKIKTKQLPELKSQIAIRKAYYKQKPEMIAATLDSRHEIPDVSSAELNALEANVNQAERPKSKFLMRTIILNHHLSKGLWDDKTRSLSGEYFEMYGEGKPTPYNARLMSMVQRNVNQSILAHSERKDYYKIIDTLKTLPKSLQISIANRNLAWKVAEAYQSTQNHEKAAEYFELANQLSENKVENFQAQIRKIENLRNSIAVQQAKGNSNGVKTLRKSFAQWDEKLNQTWNNLGVQEKEQLTVQYRDLIENNLNEATQSKTANNILLWTWKQSTSPSKGSPTNSESWKASYTPKGKTVFQLSKLSKEFLKSGDRDKHRQAKEILKNIDPERLADSEAEALWAEELTELAEMHRENNEYLDAGRIYALTGTKSRNWDKRAEALYKGGLLLYRSGRREEAVQAFEKAAGDGDNLLYAELAKKRLEQLNK